VVSPSPLAPKTEERMPWDEPAGAPTPVRPTASRPVQGGLFNAPAAAPIPPVQPRVPLPQAPSAPSRPARTGTVVEHPKYGTGTVVRREGEGDDAKLIVIFQRHGMKKLVEKYAGLKKA